MSRAGECYYIIARIDSGEEWHIEDEWVAKGTKFTSLDEAQESADDLQEKGEIEVIERCFDLDGEPYDVKTRPIE
jgi:hypothetical protein